MSWHTIKNNIPQTNKTLLPLSLTHYILIQRDMYNLLAVVCGNVWSGPCSLYVVGEKSRIVDRDAVIKAYIDIPWTLMTSEALCCFLYCFY